ncbi:MAG: hypothetical protein OEZ36_10265 [Spirochaetota bacterium]|nr:hypothetical protein [Spirochaetota bacterium]
MQVTSTAMDASANAVVHKSLERQILLPEKEHQEPNRAIQNKNVSSSRVSGAYNEMNGLMAVQANYIAAQKNDSYLEKLQRVLERFKEYSQEIAKQALSPRDTASEITSERYFQKQNQRLAQDIEQLVKEYPMLRDITRELANLKVTSAIGLKQALADISSRRQEVSSYLKELENSFKVQKTDLMNSLRGRQMPSALHNMIKADTTINLLDK